MESSTLTTSHVEIKKRMLETAIRKHQAVIDELRQSIKDMLATEGMDNEEEMGLSQQQIDTEMLQRSHEIAEHLQIANVEMKLLYDMVSTIGYAHNTVQLGSVVVTDKLIFFVSVSIEQFTLDGQKFFGLSTQSPLYKAMEGKTTGDRFYYQNTAYQINDIF